MKTKQHIEAIGELYDLVKDGIIKEVRLDFDSEHEAVEVEILNPEDYEMDVNMTLQNFVSLVFDGWKREALNPGRFILTKE